MLLSFLSMNDTTSLVNVWRSEISRCLFILFPIFAFRIYFLCTRRYVPVLICLPILYLWISFPQTIPKTVLCLALPFAFSAEASVSPTRQFLKKSCFLTFFLEYGVIFRLFTSSLVLLFGVLDTAAVFESFCLV